MIIKKTGCQEKTKLKIHVNVLRNTYFLFSVSRFKKLSKYNLTNRKLKLSNIKKSTNVATETVNIRNNFFFSSSKNLNCVNGICHNIENYLLS